MIGDQPGCSRPMGEPNTGPGGATVAAIVERSRSYEQLADDSDKHGGFRAGDRRLSCLPPGASRAALSPERTAATLVGEAMIEQSWRDHAREAQRLVTLAQTPDIASKVAIAHLYLAVVEITQALKGLETRDDD